MKSRRLKGQISIGKIHSDEPDFIRIELLDGSSFCLVARAELSMTDFAQAITGLHHIDCEFEWYPDAPIGKVAETKYELLVCDEYPTKAKALKVFALQIKELERDGWKLAYADDLHNHHRWGRDADGRKTVRALFRRYVDAPEAVEAKP